MTGGAWVQAHPPVNGAGAIDFFAEWSTQQKYKRQERYSLALLNVDSGSVGDWTLHLVRTAYAEQMDDTGTITPIVGAQILTGYDKAQCDALNAIQTVPGVATFAGPIYDTMRGSVFHYVGSIASLTLQFILTAAQPVADDRLIAWVAPGRPTRVVTRGRFTTVTEASAAGVRQRLPTFSTRMNVQHRPLGGIAPTAPVVRFYRGPNVLEDFPLSTSITAPPVTEIILPADATHFSMWDTTPLNLWNLELEQFT